MSTDVPEIRSIPDTGPGSAAEIAAYIRTVIAQRTTVNQDTTAEALGRGITYSVLNRLRRTSDLAVRADELTTEYERGYRVAEAKYREVGDLRDAVDDAIRKLTAAVTALREATNAA